MGHTRNKHADAIERGQLAAVGRMDGWMDRYGWLYGLDFSRTASKMGRREKGG